MIYSKDCWLRKNCSSRNNLSGVCNENFFCQKLFRLDELFKSSLLPEQYRIPIKFSYDEGYDIERHDLIEVTQKLLPIQNNIEDFVLNGNSVFIHSTHCGNGKTTWATRLVSYYFYKIWYKVDVTKCHALFISVPRFLLTLKDNISDKSDYIKFIKDNVLDADIVVWDEVGVKSLTPYEHENLFNLINTRIDLGKSNIYTSNLSDEELQEKIGERLYSRIVNLSTVVEFTGVDKRGLK